MYDDADDGVRGEGCALRSLAVSIIFSQKKAQKKTADNGRKVKKLVGHLNISRDIARKLKRSKCLKLDGPDSRKSRHPETVRQAIKWLVHVFLHET